VDKHTHLVKLCVGAETLEDLINWQKNPRAKGPDGLPRHVTRMWPRREEAVLAGGSLYWVIKGVILARQTILRLDKVPGGDGIERCGIVLNPEIHRTIPAPRRPFQGWRYLLPGDAPGDLGRGKSDDIPLPPKMAAALAEIGVL